MVERGRPRVMKEGVTLFARIEAEQHAALRYLAFKDHGSMAQVVRKALDVYIESRASELPEAVRRG